MTLQLVPKQREGVEFLKSHRSVILADEMGSGKTAQVLTAIQELGYRRVLVVAPKIVKSVWCSEVEKWAPNWNVMVLEGTKTERKHRAQDPPEPPFILLTHYEQLGSDYTVTGSAFYELKRVEWDAIVFDEAHYLKNRHTHRFKAAKRLLMGRYCNVFCLTGTPIINEPGDIWALLHLCDGKKYTSYWNWVSRHAMLVPNPFSRVPKIVGVRNPAETQHELSDYVLRRSKAEFHDLPPRTVTELLVDLTVDQRRAYREMALYGTVGDVSTASKLAQVTRLRQLCISPELVRGETPLRGAKLDIVEELCNDSGLQQVVVFTNYRDVAQELASRVDGVALTGDVPDNRRHTALEAFRRGDYRTICMTLGVGGVGIDLSTASVAIFVDVSWSPAINAQAADRLHRPGQLQPVTVYVLTAADTIEDRVMRLLQRKDQFFDATVPGIPTDTIIKLLNER